MMRSMFSAVSGLRVHQTKMDVIANNISNVNTVGFKSSRVTFAEVFSQSISGATGANPMTGRGGTNGMQIGLGVTVASIDKVMTQGAAQRTDNVFDLMIEGDSFFIVSDTSGQYFTRAGAFNVDIQGNLVNSQGLKVQGWMATEDPANPGKQVVPKGPVKGIQIGPELQYLAPTQSTFARLEGNVNPVTDKEIVRRLSVYDSIGNEYTTDVTFKYDETTKKWSYAVSPDAYINGDMDNKIAGIITAQTGEVKFKTDGTLDFVGAANTSEIEIVFDESKTVPPSLVGNTGGKVTLDFSMLTQFVNEISSVKAITQDGNKPGTLSGIAIGSDGKIMGKYSNGGSRILAQIAVANFKNSAALESVGNNLYQSTANSGYFDGIGDEAGVHGGSIKSGVLEMANVDLSMEFTEMITTQRGFQANSRTITTSDEMLQELVNLKR